MKKRFGIFVLALIISGIAKYIAVAHPASGIVVNAKGEVFFIHTHHGLCKIDTQGKLTYIHKDTGGHFLAWDMEGKFPSAAYPRLFQRITLPGEKAALLFASGGAPFVVNRDGKLYYGSGFPNGDDTTPGGLTLTQLFPNGKRTLFAPGLKTKLADLNESVTGLAAGPDGSLIVASPNAILNVKLDGSVTTLVHPVVVKDCEEAISDTNSVFFHQPYLRGLDLASDGTIYVAATGCRWVLKVTPDGRKLENVLKSERPWTPTGLAISGKDLFILEYTSDQPNDWAPRVRKLQADGKVETLVTLTSDAKAPAKK